MWVDIEDTALNQEQFQKTFSEFRGYTSGAMKELYEKYDHLGQLIKQKTAVFDAVSNNEQFGQGANTGQQTKGQANSSVDTHHMLMRLEAVENGLLRMNVNHGGQTDLRASSTLKDQLAKYNDNSPKDIIHQQLFTDTMNIITELQAEQKQFEQTTKILIEATNALIKSTADHVTRKLMIEIEPLRTEISVLKAHRQVSPSDLDERISV